MLDNASRVFNGFSLKIVMFFFIFCRARHLGKPALVSEIKFIDLQLIYTKVALRAIMGHRIVLIEPFSYGGKRERASMAHDSQQNIGSVRAEEEPWVSLEFNCTPISWRS